jgi:ankyrin repeat protein
MLAAAQGSSAAPAVMAALLSRGAYPDIRDSNGRTPLSWTVERGDGGAVKMLLENGADPNAVDDRGWTYMRTAWGSNHPELIRLLLSHGANINTPDNTGQTLLLVVTRSYCASDMFNLLLERGADPNTKDHDGKTPLAAALGRKDRDKISQLLQHGALPSQDSIEGGELLNWAAGRGDEEVVNLLISSGVSANASNREGSSALFKAVKQRHSQIARKLVISGADVYANETLIFVAVKNADVKTVQLLIELGAEIAKESLLYDAAWMGHLSIVQLLVDNWFHSMEEHRPECTAQLAKNRSYYLKVVDRLLDNIGEIEADAKFQRIVRCVPTGRQHREILQFLVKELCSFGGREEQEILRKAELKGYTSIVDAVRQKKGETADG